MALDLYKNLQPVREFGAIGRAASYVKVPDDWWIVITDVVNSTVAIEKGRYKEVNTAGAIALVAIANQKIHHHTPIVFGGDGVTLLTPPEFLGSIKDIFFGTRAFVKENFDLILRIGFVRVSDVTSQGHEVLLGKFSSTNPFAQAIFAGDGIDYAEKLIKEKESKYLLSEAHEAHIQPSYAGFSCPFREVPTDKDVIIALILKSKRGLPAYDRLIRELLEILGPEKDFHPLSFSKMSMETTAEGLSAWTTVAAASRSGFKFRILGIVLSLATSMMMLFAKTMRRKFSEHIPLFTDHKKFDGNLKMVLNCTTIVQAKVMAWLEGQELKGDIVFGVHASKGTLITCVFNGAEDEREIHLIDGSNGGYALAAKSLKAKLASA